MKIILDENGKPIDKLKARNEEIINSLSDVLEEFKASAARSWGKNYGFRMVQFIEDELNERCPLMTADEFTNLDVDDIDYYWRRFHNLITYYNRYFEIVPNRQMFMTYLGCNSRMYAQLKKGGENHDEVLADTMLFIDDKLLGKSYVAGESGNANYRALAGRQQASGMAGHDVISATENKLIETSDDLSALAIERQLENILGKKMLKK